ncbi:ectonucleotide pyrophosphatase/phosphodiesterase family member 7-like [Sinocyclocheilus grahami]|uniref:ectonucleotide pyrophosphatase/phosphodiesterase family member 7-like n=1 Tax=Sinocyclocheilus grahami TaxID=75366 RepID=UPI0007AD2062|nr:PREDICTED: ectonucleotide pyrophosphatase/phosphodiesterase family member 7-like [Sinocyclocheilus grahami]
MEPQLSVTQKTELEALVSQFRDVFSETLGRTTVIEHEVRTPPGVVVQQRPYRIPEARRPAIEEEVKKMYATLEKEALAIKWAVLELKYYLWGCRFTLVTNHAPLQWMSRAKDTNFCFQGLKAGSLHFPGTASTYQGESAVVREVKPENYNYSNETAWQENVDKVMKSWFGEQDLDFVSMYLGEPDSTGHKYGPDSPQRRAMVRQVDRTVGYLRSAAKKNGLSERPNIIITADHGMSTVYRNGLVDEIVPSKIPGFSFKDLDFHIVDFGPVGLLLPKEGRLDKVFKALKGAHPHLHVYKKEEIPARLHYSHNDRILPIILWADPGYVINGYFPVQFHKGEHGYDNQALDMKPFFRAMGPDFQKNLEVRPFETVNIYPLMCHLLKITPEPNDGHLNTTRHMLTSSIQTENEGSSGDDILSSVFIGLGSVAGFLFIVFVVLLSRGIHKRRGNKSSSTDEGKIDKCHAETKQTAF